VQAIGRSFTRKSLSSTEILAGLTLGEAVWLVTLGVAAVVAHAAFDRGLNLPGHHGLEWMALLVIGRRTSKYRWAATVSSVGAGVVAPMVIWGFGDPFIWLIYLLPGPIMDLGCMVSGRWQDKAWVLALIAGVAHASKPLIRVPISMAMGWPYGSLLYGVGYPVATHVAFGVLGGLIGAGVIFAVSSRRRGKKSSS
jgi:hypothetical protein